MKKVASTPDLGRRNQGMVEEYRMKVITGQEGIEAEEHPWRLPRSVSFQEFSDVGDEGSQQDDMVIYQSSEEMGMRDSRMHYQNVNRDGGLKRYPPVKQEELERKFHEGEDLKNPFKRRFKSCPNLQQLAITNSAFAFTPEYQGQLVPNQTKTFDLKPLAPKHTMFSSPHARIAAFPVIDTAGKPLKPITSCPDMAAMDSSYMRDDERRQRRLARNRASARLRRLRKRTLVETYEQDVVVLESAMKLLREHKWGHGDCSELFKSLARVERCLQKCNRTDTRKTQITEILGQYKEYFEIIEAEKLDNRCLLLLADDSDKRNSIVRKDLPPSEGRALADDLLATLDLTQDQLHEVQQIVTGLEDDLVHHHLLESCVNSLMDNDALVLDKVEEVTSDISSLLGDSQMKKFLSWTDSNAEAIGLLDQRSASDESRHDSPLFHFGHSSSATMGGDGP